MEHLKDSQFEEYAERYNELILREVPNIQITNKVRVLFNLNDNIFNIDQMVPKEDWEPKEAHSQCNLCGIAHKGQGLFSIDKCDNCYFCGDLFCSDCLWKEKQYPGNKTKKGKICNICSSKYLYREVQEEVLFKF